MKTKFLFFSLFIAFAITNVFSQTSEYIIGEIPSVFYVEDQEEVSFNVVHQIEGEYPIEYKIIVPPLSNVNFDITSFTYTASDLFKQPFTVQFMAVYVDTVVSQNVDFVYKGNLMPETSTLNTFSTYIPNTQSDMYYDVTVYKGTKTTLNNVERETRIVEISGHTIVIAEGEQIWELIHQSEDIQKVTIIADSVVFRDSLVSPQTDIEIITRSMVFEDVNGKTASITTTPKSIPYRADAAGMGDLAGDDGADGLDAGNISIYVEHIYFPEGDNKIRFIATGGDGQDAGLGRNGVNGVSRNSRYPAVHNGILYFQVFYYNKYRSHSWTGWHTHIDVWGIQAWSGNGENAIPAGIPGNAGNGNIVSCNIDIQDKCNINGGKSGLQGDTTYGGSAGTPVNARWDMHWAATGNWTHAYHTSIAGTDTIPQQADIQIGDSGAFIQNTNSYAWLHSFNARKVLMVGKEAFINGNPVFTYKAYEKYVTSIYEYEENTYWDSLSIVEQTTLSSIADEMATIMLRIENNQDYFGNVYGYSPYLSFEFLMLNYQSEIERSMRILYLVYLFENANTTLVEKINTLNLLREQKLDETQGLQIACEQANNMIPEITFQVLELQRMRDSLQIEIQTLEQQLLSQAQKNVKKSKDFCRISQIASIAGTVCTFLPFPGAQAIGAGLTMLSQLNLQDPWTWDNAEVFMEHYGNIEDGLSGYNVAAENTYYELDTAFTFIFDTPILDYFDNKALRDSGRVMLRDVRNASRPLKTAYKQIKNNWEPIKASNQEIQAELERLKASSPEYKDLLNKIQEMMIKQQLILAQHEKMMEIVMRSKNEMVQNIISIDVMNNSIANNSEYIDQEMQLYVKDMKQRANERLLKYHYLVAKSYEYRMLETYDIRLDMEGIFTRMQEILEAGQDGDLSYDEYMSLQGLYDDQISEIVSNIVNNYEFGRQQATVYFQLSEDQLEQLNQTGSFVFNPMDEGLIMDGREDVRTLNISISNADYHVGNGSKNHLVSNILIQHSGISTFVKNGVPYTFYNISGSNLHPFSWASNIDVIGNEITHEGPSPLDESLLNMLLELGGHGDANILYYSAPATDANLIVTKTDNSNDGSVLVLDDLVVKVEYDYTNQPTNIVKIEAQSNVGMPLFYLDMQDINNRKDGYANFNRYLNKSYSNNVEITAPEFYGTYKFDNWTDKNGQPLQGMVVNDNVVTVPLYQNQSVKANYILWRTELDLNKDTVYVSFENDNFDCSILSIGNNLELDWQVESLPEWIEINSDTSGIGEALLEFNCQENTEFEERVGEVIIINTEVIGDIDTLIIIQEPFVEEPELSIISDSINVEWEESIQTIAVTNGGTGTINYNCVSNSDWITIINGQIGDGDGEIIILCEENPYFVERQGAITITETTTGQILELNVFQDAQLEIPIIETSITDIVFPENENSVSIYIENIGTGTLLWTCEISGDGFSIISGETGVQEGYIVVHCEENGSIEERTGILTIFSQVNKDVEVITLTQEGHVPLPQINSEIDTVFVSVNEEYFNIPFENIGENIMEWNASIEGSWLSFVNLSSGSGNNDELIILADENYLPIRRVGRIILNENLGSSDTIIVVQEANITNLISDNFILQDVSVFPNPFIEYITIKPPSNNSYDIKIIDIQGKTVYKSNINNSLKEIDLSGLSSGVYILNVRQDNIEKVIKLIKQ